MSARLRGLWADAAARRDVLLALVLLAFAALVYAEALKLPPPFFDPLGSAALPKGLAVVVAGLAVLMVVGHLRRHDLGAALEASDEVPARADVAFGVVVVALAFTAVMQAGLLGFREAAFLAVLGLGAVLARFDRRRVLWIALLGLIAGVGLDAIFTHVLYVDLPRTIEGI